MIEQTTVADGRAVANVPERESKRVRPGSLAGVNGYIANLDGIRGIAVLLVLASHTVGLFGGMLGVDIFFVLSGFLITNLLLVEHESNTSLAVFYWRRFLRLMPALAVLTFAVLLASPHLPRASSPRCEVLAPLLGVANWTMPFGLDCPKYMGHAWSLSVEEQFYLVWPLLLLASLKLGGVRSALALAIALTAGCGLWRAYLALHGANITRIYWPLDTRCDGLLMGAAAALAQFNAGTGWFYRVSRLLWIPAALALIAIVALAKSHTPFFVGGYTIIAVLSVILIVAASRANAGLLDRLLGAKPLVYLGTLSYGFYLWHYPIAVQAGRWKVSGGVKFVVVGGLAFCLAYLSKRLVEIPLLRLRPQVVTRPWLGWIVACTSTASVIFGIFLFLP